MARHEIHGIKTPRVCRKDRRLNGSAGGHADSRWKPPRAAAEQAAGQPVAARRSRQRRSYSSLARLAGGGLSAAASDAGQGSWPGLRLAEKEKIDGGATRDRTGVPAMPGGRICNPVRNHSATAPSINNVVGEKNKQWHGLRESNPHHSGLEAGMRPLQLARSFGNLSGFRASTARATPIDQGVVGHFSLP